MDGEDRPRRRPQPHRSACGNGEYQAWATSKDPALTVAPPAAPDGIRLRQSIRICVYECAGRAPSDAASRIRAYIHGRERGQDGPALRVSRRSSASSSGSRRRRPRPVHRVVRRHATTIRHLAERPDRTGRRGRGADRLRAPRRGIHPGDAPVAPHGDAPTDRRPAQAAGELGTRLVLIHGRPGTRVRSAWSLIEFRRVSAPLKSEGETIQEWLTLFR